MKGRFRKGKKAYKFILTNTVKVNDCLEFQGARTEDGYGITSLNGKQTTAHRAIFIIKNGPIKKGLVVCHSCDNPPCVNPDHLFSGTQLDNMRDMTSKGRRNNKRKNSDSPICIRGHLKTPSNSIFKNGKRVACRECHKMTQKRHRNNLKNKQHGI